MKPYRLKYRNKRCSFDGYSFDSLKEKKRYIELRAMEKQGFISHLKVHPRYPLILPDGTPVVIRGQKRKTRARYTADFTYLKNDQEIVEDVKSIATMTEASKLRMAIFEALYKIEVTIV